MSNQTIRVRAGALLMRDNQVLLVEIDNDQDGLHYNYPGGGVEPGEGLHEALRRELLEEACAEIEIHRLLCVYEYVPPQANYRFGSRPGVSFLFLCTLQPGYEPRLPDVPDPNQTAIRWVNLHQLDDVPVIPHGLQSRLVAALDMPDHFDPFAGHW